MTYKKNTITQIVIKSNAKKNMDCPHLQESIYGLFVCVSPRVIKMAEKLKASNQIIVNCCGIFNKTKN